MSKLTNQLQIISRTAYNKVVSKAIPKAIKNYYGLPLSFPIGQYVPQRQTFDPKDIGSYIAPVQLLRIRQDAATWRGAVLEAENAWYPHRVKQQTLYIDTVLNGHVRGCMNKRRNLTLLRDFRLVDKNGKLNEEWTKYFKAQWFFDYIEFVIDSRFYGYSLIEIGDIIDGRPSEVKIVKRWNISPDRHNVTSLIYMVWGQPFLEKPFKDWLIWVPTKSESGASNCGYGLLYEAGLYEIFCRNLLGFNGDNVEVFGQPLRWAKTDHKQQDPEYAILESAMRNIGSNAYIITDHNDEVVLIEPKTNMGANNPYENLETRCEKKISKIILGHPDVIDSPKGHLGAGGSGKTGNSAAQDAITEIQVVDGRLIETVTNEQLLPKFRNIGIAIPEDLIGQFANDDELQESRQTEDQNNLLTAQWVSLLKQAGYSTDIDELSERIGFDLEAVAPPEPDNTPVEDVANKMRNIIGKHKHLEKVNKETIKELDNFLTIHADQDNN